MTLRTPCEPIDSSFRARHRRGPNSAQRNNAKTGASRRAPTIESLRTCLRRGGSGAARPSGDLPLNADLSPAWRGCRERQSPDWRLSERQSGDWRSQGEKNDTSFLERFIGHARSSEGNETLARQCVHASCTSRRFPNERSGFCQICSWLNCSALCPNPLRAKLIPWKHPGIILSPPPPPFFFFFFFSFIYPTQAPSLQDVISAPEGEIPGRLLLGVCAFLGVFVFSFCSNIPAQHPSRNQHLQFI